MAGAPTVLHAETPSVYMKADLTSSYLWRGQREASFSLQPVLGLKWKGLDVYLWGNEQLDQSKEPDTGKHEIDLVGRYKVLPNWTVGFKNVYVNSRGAGFFSYGPIQHSGNGLDVLVDYSCRWFSAEWTTTVAGYDGYDHHGHRSYGSYLQVSVPFAFSYFDFDAKLGVVPYYCSRYDDDSNGFHVNMLALTASHKFAVNKQGSMSVMPYMQLMVNPSSRRGFFQAGVQWAFGPKNEK